MDRATWDGTAGLQASIVVKPVNNGIMKSFESVGKASNRGRERRMNLATPNRDHEEQHIQVRNWI